MSETLTLFIPCEIYEVSARVSPSEHLTPLEQLVIEAIGVGADSLEALKSLFQLGDRLTREILLDLLKNNYITIDPIGSTIRLSGTVAGRDRKGLGALAAAHVEERQCRVMRELVSGHLLPFPFAGAVTHPGRAPAPPSARLIPGRIPPEARDEFLDALTRSVQTELRRSSLRLVSAGFPVARGDELIPTRRQYLRLRARVGREPASGDLIFRIENPVQLPPQVRRGLGRGLTVLAKEAATDPFFRSLEGKVPSLEERWEGPAPALEFLRRTLEGLEGKGIGVVPERHERLTSIRNEVVSLLEEREEARIEAECVAGAENILESVREAILGAQRQLVLITPTSGTSEPIREAIRQVIADRRVQVFLLWGKSPDEGISTEFAGWVTLLAGSEYARFVRAARFSGRTRTPMVIRDATLAVLGTEDFFRYRYTSVAANHPEVALVLRSGDGTPSAAIGDILQWANDAFSPQDGDLLAQIRVRGSDWRDPDDPPPDPGRRVQIPSRYAGLATELTAPTIREAGTANAGEADVAVKIWRDLWKGQLSLLEQWHGGQGGFATRITDDEHRSLLLRAVRSAMTRLVIATPLLAPDAVDDAFLLALRRRLERTQLQVVVIYGNDVRNVIQPLLRLEDHFAPRMRVLRVANNAGLLVWDDEVLFSGQGPLSFKTIYGPGGRRQGTVLGVHLHHPSVAETLLRELARQLPQEARAAIESLPRPAPVIPPPAPAEADVSAREVRGTVLEGATLQHLLRKLADAGNEPRRRTRVIREHFSSLDPEGDTLWGALDQLQQAELDELDLERAVCASLAAPGAHAHGEYRRWVRFLAGQAWRDHRFFDTASFLAALGGAREGEGLPTRRVAELAALRAAQQPFEDRLLDVAVNGARDQHEAEAATLTAAIALAEHGWPYAADFLSEQREAWPRGVAPGFEALLGFVARFGRPFPLDQLQRASAERETQRARQEAQAAFFAAFEEAESIHLDFELGKRMLGELFPDDKPLGILRSAVAAGEADQVHTWMAEYRRDQRAVGRLIDAAAARAAMNVMHPAPIHASRRAGLIRRFYAVVQAAHAWADTAQVHPSHVPDALVVEATALGQALVGYSPALSWELAQRRAAGDPIIPLLETWLQLLAPLFQTAPPEAR
jgi:hypothetical protein